jgi:hypothetical protein
VCRSSASRSSYGPCFPAERDPKWYSITEKIPQGFRIADKLDDAHEWALCQDESLTRKTGELPRHVPGKFDLRQVEDEERGRCLELELRGDNALSDYIGEYCAIAAAKPAAIPGEPTTCSAAR